MEYFPLGQGWQSVDALLLPDLVPNLPRLHGVQVLSPGRSVKLPMLQLRHTALPLTGLYLPALQSAQASLRSLSDSPGVSPYWPGTHWPGHMVVLPPALPRE